MRKTGGYPPSAVQAPLSGNSSSISNYSNSANSKTIGSGVSRRPSENLLMNMANTGMAANASEVGEGESRNKGEKAMNGRAEEEEEQMLSFKPPNRKAVLLKSERPISNESINTTGDVFSMGATSSKDSSRGTSIIDDEAEESNIRGKQLQNDEEDCSQLTEDSYSDADLSMTTMKVASTPQSMNTKYVFNSGAQAKSYHESFQGLALADPSIKANSHGRGAVHNGAGGVRPSNHHHPLSSAVHSKSVPSLPSDAMGKNPLTPSQRYRLRREQNKLHLQNSIKQKELFYDEESKLPANDTVDEKLVWSIPLASHSSTFLSQRKHRASMPNLSKNGSGKFLDTHDMPPSPIPGVQNVSDLEYFQQVGKNLSAVYQKSEYQITKTKLLERTRSAELLPLEFKNASDEGMEDLKLVSESKVSVVTNTRPSWLPPKDSVERKSHEREVRKTLSMASIEKLESNHRRHEQEIKDDTNRQKLVLLIDRGLNRKSSIQDMRKVAFETGLCSDKRFGVYNSILNTEYNIITTKYVDKLESLDKIIRSKTTPFASNQLNEFKRLVTDMHVDISPEIRNNMIKLLQWKSISRFGLQIGDNYLMHHFLLEGFSLEQTWQMVNLLQLTCFNSITRDKYDNRIMQKKGVVGRYMRNDTAFEDEFDSRYLNYMTLWNCLARLDHALFLWVLDIIVAENAKVTSWTSDWNSQLQDVDWDTFRDKHVAVNYKILCSLTLSILLNYHFGWNNLLHLDELPSKFKLVAPIDDYEPVRDQHVIFIKKWIHYYKKF